jgi:hypothetical protein
LQLSDASGSFSSGFSNLGSIIDTLPGTFTINSVMPKVSSSSSHYRFRMIAAVPYTVSADNGSDVNVGAMPSPIILERNSPGAINKPISYEAIPGGPDNPTDSLYWDFGADANPATYGGVPTKVMDAPDPTTTYSTGGDKTVSISAIVPGGCSRTLTFTAHIFDCTIPPIPHYAIVIANDTTFPDQGKVLWVNPGVTINVAGYADTIYAEPGSTISNGTVNYLKTGSSYTSGYGVVIYAPGASVSLGTAVSLPCSTFDFDYTNAPPNAAHPLGVKNDIATLPISISPNPTTGILTVEGAPLDIINISIMNILGEKAMDVQNPHSSSFNLDISKLVRGTYYIRFATSYSVVTKKVIKE